MASSPAPSDHHTQLLPSTPRTTRSSRSNKHEAPPPYQQREVLPDISSQRAPYGQYQLNLYTESLLTGQKPVVTCDPNKLEEQAKAVMEHKGFEYVLGGAGEQSTVTANRKAFSQWRLVPRMLKGHVGRRDMSVKLFGRTYDSPILMAPIGVQKAYHASGENATASACADLGVPFIYSTASSTTLEEIVSEVFAPPRPSTPPTPAPPQSPASAAQPIPIPLPPREKHLWFQLYWPLDDDITASLLSRARVAGCEVLVVTLDTPSLSWRPLDLDNGFLPFAVGEGNALGFSDPVVQKRFADRFTFGGDEPPTIEDNTVAASRFWAGEVFSGYAHKWEDLGTLRRLWGEERPIVLKGILSVEDAKMAVEYGVNGIIVSNHGGRQLDGAVPALEVLPEIVDSVGEKITVMFDSGIRTGADVLKALALGAKAVLVGRPVIYGLGIAGYEGARHVLAGLLADVDQSMGLVGVRDVAGLNRSLLRRINYG
ncbi:hypothetical protein QBC38DRAFT_463433 [Podospora fimiseda]|uniref:FMN hydroxy acid dehydrogenase domain-containing protein n=1 Tax=Podospora fimiseda TaxID=252190 RepID=A0AAN7BZE3_9PEZI|nr:hypothetical protein QBC38DRAFT_463433 [Podospora fimiseda]